MRHVVKIIAATGSGVAANSGGGPPAFSPLSLTPTAWYDPSDLTTLFQDSAMTTPVTSDSDVVGAMMDKSGNGNHLLQATTANKPLYKTSAGLHWIEGDGVDDGLLSGVLGSNLSQPTTLAIGFQYSGAAADKDILDIQTTNADRNVIGDRGNEFIMFAGFVTGLGAFDTNRHTLICKFNGASGSSILDGGAPVIRNAGGAAPSASAMIAVLKHAAGGTPECANAKFFGGIVLPDALTNQEEADLATWLDQKTNGT